MRIVLAVLMVALLAVPAFSERGKKSSQPQQQQSAEQKKKAEAAEKDYKNALDRIPNQKPADPWAKIR